MKQPAIWRGCINIVHIIDKGDTLLCRARLLFVLAYTLSVSYFRLMLIVSPCYYYPIPVIRVLKLLGSQCHASNKLPLPGQWGASMSFGRAHAGLVQ